LGDTTNWEFAAAVAAISIGLGGLLLFTLIGTLGSWRLFQNAARAAIEAEKASMAVQDLARQLPAAGERQDVAAAERTALRAQVEALATQQARLRDAVRRLHEEAGAQRAQEAQLAGLALEMERLERDLNRIADAVVDGGRVIGAHDDES
jgi:chromosome segregation ATPase